MGKDLANLLNTYGNGYSNDKKAKLERFPFQAMLSDFQLFLKAGNELMESFHCFV